MTHHIFPDNSFPNDTPFKDLFREKSYGFADIKNLRTSLHYSRSVAEGPWYQYEVAIGHACKQDDGNFHVFVIRSKIRENNIDHVLCSSASDVANEPAFGCKTHEVIDVLTELDKKLAAESFRSLPYPHNAPLRIHDDLHFRVAARLVHPRSPDNSYTSFTKADILYNQNLLRLQML